MVKHEIDKETLRHDAFRETMFGAVGYVLRHQKWFITGGIAVVVLAASIFGGSIYMAHQRQVNSEVYYHAEKLLQDTGTDDKAKLQAAQAGLEKYVKEHPDSAHAPVAWMHIAQLAWRQKDLDRAETAFKSVVDHSKANETTVALASIGLAKLLENRGDYAGSNGLYRELDDEQFADVKAFHLGRIAWLQKNPEEARKQFQSAADKSTLSAVRQWAQDLLSFLP